MVLNITLLIVCSFMCGLMVGSDMHLQSIPVAFAAFLQLLSVASKIEKLEKNKNTACTDQQTDQ